MRLGTTGDIPFQPAVCNVVSPGVAHVNLVVTAACLLERYQSVEQAPSKAAGGSVIFLGGTLPRV